MDERRLAYVWSEVRVYLVSPPAHVTINHKPALWTTEQSRTRGALSCERSRMTAYFRGEHHPQQVLLPRVGYIALAGDAVVGYTAGHRTTRHGCAGEIQYLFVAPAYRRRGVATALLQRLAEWFRQISANNVCVCVDADSPDAEPFYDSVGASRLKRYWRVWNDIGVLCR